MPRSSPITWCAPDGQRPWEHPAFEGLSIVGCTAEELIISAASVVVLDGRAFPSSEALRTAYERLTHPAMVLLDEGDLVAALEWLRADDAPCLTSSPAPLIAHQLRQLLGRRAYPLDSLTGLAHRQQLLDALARILPTASEAHPVSLLLLDIDHFKEINDRHGHHVGDAILRELAGVLSATCEGAVLVARVGGEEMVVLLRDDEKVAVELAEGVRRAAAAHRFSSEVRLTVSIGVAVAEEPVDHPGLLNQLDEAIYAAKAQGRDQVVSYPSMARTALDNDEDMALTAFENLTRVVADRIAATITRRGRRMFQEIKQQADVDALTGLYSRRYLDRRLGHDFDAATDMHKPLCVALIDIDFFGAVNKEHGWPSGDAVLTDLSRLVTEGVRGADWVGRYGGEELCLVMPATELPAAVKVLERIRTSVEDYDFRSTAGELIRLTVSAGVAEHVPHDGDLEALVERMSQKLLEAKRGGRNRVCS